MTSKPEHHQSEENADEIVPELKWALDQSSDDQNSQPLAIDDSGYFNAGINETEDVLPVDDSSNRIDNERTNDRWNTRTTLRYYSSMVQDNEFSVDERMLEHILHDVGSNGYGLQGISVWMFDDDTHRLNPIKGGWWHNQNIPFSDALSQLTDSQRKDHIPPVPVSGGVDIAGLLWLESNKIQRADSMLMRLSMGAGSQSFGSLRGLEVSPAEGENTRIIWRDLRSLVHDPDTAKGPRLSLLEKAGFGRATGITFNTSIGKGLVIYFASNDLEKDLFHGMPNCTYLQQSSKLIGSCAAMGEARRAIVGQRMMQKLRPSSNVGEEGLPNAEESKERQEQPQKQSWWTERSKVWLTKLKGGAMQIPPALSLTESMWTALGAFCGLLCLSALNEYYKFLSDDEYFLLIGPFGALMTLQYGLTAAPASQPRNAVCGQATAGAVSLAFTYIPESLLPVWIRRAVGPALGIATMVKFGFTHPPAGAHAVLYASGKYNWSFYALVVLSTVVAVIPATFVNNLNMKRQYPTYWGFVLPPWAKHTMKTSNQGTKEPRKNGT